MLTDRSRKLRQAGLGTRSALFRLLMSPKCRVLAARPKPYSIKGFLFGEEMRIFCRIRGIVLIYMTLHKKLSKYPSFLYSAELPIIQN